MFEIEFMRNDIRGCLNNIASWVTDQSVEKVGDLDIKSMS